MGVLGRSCKVLTRGCRGAALWEEATSCLVLSTAGSSCPWTSASTSSSCARTSAHYRCHGRETPEDFS